MTKIIAQSTNELADINTLLNKSLPTYRQAYSDRTAWRMACLSELAYVRFNPLFSNDKLKEYFVKSITKLVSDNKKKSLVKLIDVVGYDDKAEKELLVEELDILKFELIDTFDCNGTQAILVKTNEFITLAFRGTEATSIKDIKSDAKAITKQCETGGNIHSGFDEAFNNVAIDIQNKINESEITDIPLFITGHSLGGALATIAAKKLTHKGGLAACYTYGSPRVGDEEWVSEIKTPLYRLVNAADCVTMMPPGAETITIFSWLFGFIPGVGMSLRKTLLSKFGGYLHGGNMRYLTNCNPGEFESVKLLYSVSFFHRIKALFVKKLPFSKTLGDHSISLYRKKLMFVAKHKNKSIIK